MFRNKKKMKELEIKVLKGNEKKERKLIKNNKEIVPGDTFEYSFSGF